MGSKIQRVTPLHTPGSGISYPLTGGAAATVYIRPPAIAGQVELQVLGASTDTFSVSVPAIAAGAIADVAYSYNPKGFPTSFTLVAGASGMIFANITFTALPKDCGEIGISQSLSFGAGGAANPGSTLWTLQPQIAYQLASISGTIRFFSPKGCDAQSVTVLAFTALVATPPTVT
jgi:hypothetical protein